MSSILLRASGSIQAPGATVKGSPLTNIEVDNNFSNLSITSGILSNLTTTSNANLVSAINEVNNKISNSSSNIGILSNLTTTSNANLVSAINEINSLTNLVDSNVGILSSLTTTNKSNIVFAINELNSNTRTNTGILSNLTTTSKSNLVSAINEVDANVLSNKAIVLADLANVSQGASLIGYKYPAANAISQTVANILNYSVNVLSFGADPTGVLDSSRAIQNAINAISVTGGIVDIPVGTFNVASTINITNNGIWIRGSGWGTIITRSTNHGDTFSFIGNSTSGVKIVNCAITDLQIKSTGLTTSGAHIKMFGVTNTKIDNISIQDGFIGFSFFGIEDCYFTNLYLTMANIFGGSSSGRRYLSIFAATGSYSSLTAKDVVISNFIFKGNASSSQEIEYGVRISCADGVLLSDGMVSDANIANFIISPETTTEKISSVLFNNIKAENAKNHNLYFVNASNTIHDVKFTNCTFKGGQNALYGLVTALNASAYNVQFTNCSFYGHQKAGVHIQSNVFNKIFFNDCSIYGNNKDGSGAPGYNFLANVKDIYVNGGRSGGHETSFSSNGTQFYGIQATSGTSNIIISNCDLTNNLSGPVGGGDAANIIFNNCVTSESSTIASASTLNIPYIGSVFNVTGNTTINSFRNSFTGRMVTLVFQNSPIVTNGGNKILAGNLSAIANTTLTVMYNGTNWMELFRSVNS